MYSYTLLLLIILAVALVEGMLYSASVDLNCNRQDTFKCGDGICITKDALCDLYDDCEDGSDENNCTDHVCPRDKFRCKSGQCVWEASRCNGEDDCADNSDEENCRQCNGNSWDSLLTVFKCKSNNKCLSRKKLCNSIKDCPDGSDEDEKTCKNLQCSSMSEFQCRTGYCIRKRLRCIGYDQCGDNSGETNCTECASYFAFKCEQENKCIPREKLCNMEPDCEDGSDEIESTCQTSECRFEDRCQNGQCAEDFGNPHTLLCNGHNNDCKDESDEANCTHCSAQAYKCGSGECVHKSELCNTIVDCSDGSDENEINCPDRSTPLVWTTSWDSEHTSSTRNVTLQYLTDDLAVYFDSSVNSSVTWPFFSLTKAWEYAKTTFGKNSFLKPETRIQRLYVVLGKRKFKYFWSTYALSFTDPKSGYRNILDVGLRERNAWATENSGNFEKLFSDLGRIIIVAEEGEFHLADYKICDIGIREILFYDIYIYLKGAKSSDVLRWRDNQLNTTLQVGKINCFRGTGYFLFMKHMAELLLLETILRSSE